MADTQWNIEYLLATAVAYMRDVGMPNEADAIIELQRRAATQPADAALDDALDNVGLAFDRNSQYATTMRKAASAIRARPQAVPKHINAVYFDVPAQPRSAYVMGWNDCIDSMLAASQSATGAK